MIATATLLGLAAATAVIGAGVSAYGMYNQGQAQKQMSDYNSKVQQQSAVMADQQAQYQSSLIQQRNNRLRGAQAAAVGKSGITLGGSASDVMYDSSIQGELDSLSDIYKGNVSANRAKSGAAMSEAEGRSAVNQSYYSMAGTLLSGAGQGLGYLGKIKQQQDDMSYPEMG